jgi:hypothetical protein
MKPLLLEKSEGNNARNVSVASDYPDVECDICQSPALEASLVVPDVAASELQSNVFQSNVL